MKKPLRTFYIFDLPRYHDDRRSTKPRLLKLEGVEMGGRREGRVKLTKWSPQLGHSTIVGRGRLAVTPELALHRYRTDLEAECRRLRKQLALAEYRLDRIPDEPGQPHEDV